jgi:dipeptidase E
MKLLLVSAGISNKSIEKSLENLADRPLKELKVAFIPTASHGVLGDKSWVIRDMVICQKLFKSIDIVEITVLNQAEYLNRLKKVDVIFTGGGNPGFLSYWMNKSGLNIELKNLLKDKIYIGSSAGAMIITRNIFLDQLDYLYNLDFVMNKSLNQPLKLVDFSIIPHYNDDDFPNINDENLQELADKTGETIYALDDDSAIVVDGKKIEVISEGKWRKFSK